VTPSSWSKYKPSKQQEAGTHLAAFFVLVASLAYSLGLKIEAVRSTETSVNSYQRTQRRIPKRLFFIVFAVRASNPGLAHLLLKSSFLILTEFVWQV
jgi:hypothetical protein